MNKKNKDCSEQDNPAVVYISTQRTLLFAMGNVSTLKVVGLKRSVFPFALTSNNYYPVEGMLAVSSPILFEEGGYKWLFIMAENWASR